MAQNKKGIKSEGIPKGKIEGSRPSFFVFALECLAPQLMQLLSKWLNDKVAKLQKVQCLAPQLSPKLQFEWGIKNAECGIRNFTPNSELRTPNYTSFYSNLKRATRPLARSLKFTCGGGR